MTNWHDTSKGLVPQVPHPAYAHPMAYTLSIPISRTLTHAGTELHAAMRQDAQVKAEGRKRPNLEKQATTLNAEACRTAILAWRRAILESAWQRHAWLRVELSEACFASRRAILEIPRPARPVAFGLRPVVCGLMMTGAGPTR